MKPFDPQHYEPRRYEVQHLTAYDYAADVTASYGRACLRPRGTATQRVVEHTIRVEPEPGLLSEHTDLFGNASHYVEILQPHRRLEVVKTSVVQVDPVPRDLTALNRWTVAQAAAATPPGDPTLAAAYLLPSALIRSSPPLHERAVEALASDAPLGDALDRLITGIYTDFTYASGVTTVKTSLAELLDLKAGVCQDFAHLAIGCLRAVGLAARYVSGYLETQPPPGRPKLRGADATHAWASVGLPDGTWLDLDPTNDCIADGRYVTTAWGRDYRDVTPLKGVIFTEGTTSSLTVSVDVHRVGS